MNNDIQWDKYLPKADHSTNPFDVLVGDLPSLAVNLTNPYDQTLSRAQNQGGKVLLSPVPDRQERALEEVCRPRNCYFMSYLPTSEKMMLKLCPRLSNTYI